MNLLFYKTFWKMLLSKSPSFNETPIPRQHWPLFFSVWSKFFHCSIHSCKRIISASKYCLLAKLWSKWYTQNCSKDRSLFFMEVTLYVDPFTSYTANEFPNWILASRKSSSCKCGSLQRVLTIFNISLDASTLFGVLSSSKKNDVVWSLSTEVSLKVWDVKCSVCSFLRDIFK